jgi:predicted DsbA family dithiol-disulfide isomerase
MKRRELLALSAALAACKPATSSATVGDETPLGAGTSAAGSATANTSTASSAPPSETAPSQAPAEGPSVIRVDVWHDVICPWCRIGLTNLHAALDAWRGLPIALNYRPFQLEPATPLEGVDLRQHLQQKYQLADTNTMFDRVNAAGAQSGITFNWERVTIMPQTLLSHVLIRAATGRERDVLHALHVAYFDEGKNIGQREVLLEIASSASLNSEFIVRTFDDAEQVAAIRTEAAQASQSGIRGVPHFQIGNQTLRGAQGPDAIRRAFELAAG